MYPIPMRDHSSLYQTGQSDLTFAQQQAFRKLPHGLIELVERGVVTAQWALALPDRRQTSLGHPNICDLLADDIIKPADIAKNFDDNHLYALERSATIRSNLSDSIITTDQFSALNMDQLATLIDPIFQMKLSHFENRKKLKEGNLTVLDLLQGFRSGSSGISSGAPSTSPRSGLTDAQRQALKYLPVDLVALVDRGVVTAQWALSVPDRMQHGLGKESICALLADGIITTEQYETIKPEQLRLLLDPKFQLELRRLETQKLLKEGSITIQGLMYALQPESSGDSSSSSSSSFRASSTSSTADLTEAQQKAYKKLPYVLVEQIDKRVVTAQWALSLPEHLLVKLSKQNLCELLGERIIEPVDITDHFNAVHLAYLECSPTVRGLLRDKVITPKQFANLKRVEIEQLIDPQFVKLLRGVASQQVDELLLMRKSDTVNRGSRVQ